MRCALAACALLLPLVACSDAERHTAGGYAALGSGRAAEAADHLEAALALVGDDLRHPQYRRAWLGRIQALCELDPKVARDEFFALAHQDPELGPDEFAAAAGCLVEAEAYLEAVDVLAAGLELDPEAAVLHDLARHIVELTKDLPLNPGSLDFHNGDPSPYG